MGDLISGVGDVVTSTIMALLNAIVEFVQMFRIQFLLPYIRESGEVDVEKPSLYGVQLFIAKIYSGKHKFSYHVVPL